MTARVVPAELDLYDVAFLAGGPERVAETAVVALARDGDIRVHSPGRLARCGRTPRHAAEAAVLDALGPMGHRDLDAVRWRTVEDERVRAIGVRLHKDGLLGHGGATIALLRGDPRWLAPTRAGRAALRALGERPALADPEVVAVALGGPDRMRNRALHAAIFAEPQTGGAPYGRPRRETSLAAAGGFGLIEGRFDGY
jgi:hypothetical protein